MYAKFLKNGHSSGDNLLGFVIDVETYLEDSDNFFDVTVNSTKNVESLIVATCKYNDKLSEDEVAKELKNLWEFDLRYTEFEKHEDIISEGKVVLHFCSTSGSLGVTGKITATCA